MELLAIALVLGAALIPLVVPLFRPPLLALHSASGPAAQLRALESRKAAIYGAIREVGFDLRTDKVEQNDYDQQIAVLKREAVEVVGAIQELRSNPPLGSKKVEAAIAAVRQGAPAPKQAPPPREQSAANRFCTQCGQAAGDDDLFCAKCGTGLEAAQ